MHREHDHRHPHSHGHDYDQGHSHSHDNGDGYRYSLERQSRAPHGHNGPGAAQWQTPHVAGEAQVAAPPESADLDLVEAAFCDSFPSAVDPLSFLRLAGVALEGFDEMGAHLRLLRVEMKDATDVGALTPHVGGGSFRYDPLPGRMASRRKHLAFVYFDGAAIQYLSLDAARTLASSPAQIGEKQ